MEFSEEVKNRAFVRANLKCECTNMTCGHKLKCEKTLFRGDWHVVEIKSPNHSDNNSINNCKVICDNCYKKYIWSISYN